MKAQALPSCFILLVLALPSRTAAQVKASWEAKAENFHFRVKNIEYFIDRFNNQPEGQGYIRVPDRADTAAYLHWLQERDAAIFSLVDYPVFLQGKPDRNSLLEFFRNVNNPYQPQFIAFTDSLWFAVIEFQGTLDAKPITAKVVLNVMQTGAVTEWSLRRFVSASMAMDYRYSGSIRFVPSVHGTDFMGVRIAFADAEWVSKTLAANGNASAAWLSWLYSGRLSLTQITSISYHFTQLPGWVLTSTYVNRESKNSGWLVNELLPLTDPEKTQYRKTLHLD